MTCNFRRLWPITAKFVCLLFTCFACVSNAGVFLSEAFDGVTAPTLPAGWIASVSTTGVMAWATSTTIKDTSPNAAFASNPAFVSDSRLTSPSFLVTNATARLTFRHWYDLEADSTFGYDGGILEISIAGGIFDDIKHAGGTFVTNGYTRPIADDSFGSPLAGRMVWSGNSGGFLTTVVALPVAAAGNQIQLRWRCGTDNSIGASGWYIDNILVDDGSARISPMIINLTRNVTNFTFSFATVSGQNYTVEYKDSLSASNWTSLQTLSGDGSVKSVTNFITASPQRFYRVKSP